MRPQGGGACTLLIKGADDVVFDKLGKVSTEQRHLIDGGVRHVDHFASQGLRTLVLAKRTLDEVSIFIVCACVCVYIYCVCVNICPSKLDEVPVAGCNSMCTRGYNPMYSRLQPHVHPAH